MTSNIKKVINESSCPKLIRALVKEVLLFEKKKQKKRRKKKRGGGLTDYGAKMRNDPQGAISDLKSALSGAPADGRVEAAAEELGVSPSSIYHYTSEDPKAHAPPALKGYLNVLDGQDRKDSADNSPRRRRRR